MIFTMNVLTAWISVFLAASLAIIANQTPIMDCVSGATYTSTGIKQAVLDALSQTVIRGTLPSL